MTHQIFFHKYSNKHEGEIPLPLRMPPVQTHRLMSQMKSDDSSNFFHKHSNKHEGEIPLPLRMPPV